MSGSYLPLKSVKSRSVSELMVVPLAPLPWLNRRRVIPQSSFCFPRVRLNFFSCHICWHILSIPPAPALLYELLIEVHPIGQEHIGKGAPIIVCAVRLECDFFSGLFGFVAEGLSLLRTVDAARSDALRVLIVQDFDGVAIKDGDDMAENFASIDR